MAKPKAVIFDLYGVLAINGWQAFKAAHFAEREHIWHQIFHLGRRVDAGLAHFNELVRFTAEQSGETEATVRHQLEHTIANNELLEFIGAELHGHYRLGVLSNASNDAVIERIFTPQQRGLFDAIVLSHHVGLTKPDMRIFAAVAERLGVIPEECLFVDDQERHVNGAREAGMQAVVYTDVAELKELLAGLA